MSIHLNKSRQDTVSSLILSPDTAGASEAFAFLSYNFYLTIGKRIRSDTISCLNLIKKEKRKCHEPNSCFHNRLEGG